HFADNIGGEIVEQAAVHEDFVALANGSENSGNRYGGAHGIGERAIRKDERFSGDEFSGNATEGNRQFVEGRNVGVIEGFAVDQEIDLVAGVEALRKGGSVFQADDDGIGNLAGIFLAAEKEVLVGRAAAEEFRPVGIFQDVAQFVGGLSRGVHAADEAAHAG